MKLKEFWYSNLEAYLDKADQYDNPKQIKMFSENKISNNLTEVLAVTYLRTCIMGIQAKLVAGKEVEPFVKALVEHGHARGVILEVGKLS